MQGFTFIFRIFALTALLSLSLASPAYSADGDEGFLTGPFSEYGDFGGDEDEESDERFFQNGRFFGVGLGLGITTPTGNAGSLYKGGFPAIDFRLNYWFDFFVALQLSVKNSVHNYDALPDGRTRTNLFRVMAQIKYYFDTKDLSAPITFISPHLILGGGMYRRTDNMTNVSQQETASAFGLNGGAGIELTIKPKKFYLQIDSIVNVVTFRDAYDNKYQQSTACPSCSGPDDRTGLWIDTTASFVWTW